MGGVWNRTETTGMPGYARRMSAAVSLALVTYALLQVVLALSFLPREQRSALPYAALALLVIGVIPACRAMEARWARLGDEARLGAAGLEARFRRERRSVWLAAVGLPLALTAGFRLIGL